MKVGIAYRDNGPLDWINKTLEQIGVDYVNLPQVKSEVIEYDENNYPLTKYLCNDMVKLEYATKVLDAGYEKSNVLNIMEGIDALVMSGGLDIAPTFLKNPKPRANDDEPFNPARDISDFLYLQYAIAKDIPTLCICRGMQLLGIYSGCELIQHLPTYYQGNGKEYKDSHRLKDKSWFQRHDIEIIDKDSKLYKIFGDSIANTYSWHHQAIMPFDNIDNLKLTAIYNDGELDVVEGIERTDKKFMVGVQCHPENGIDEKDSIQYFDDIKVFKALIEAAK